MSGGFLFALTLVSALGCGVVGGVFFAFSGFVMKALSRLPPAQGIAAMQSINIAVLNPLFMVTLFGTAVGTVALAIASLFRWREPGTAYVFGGSLVYLVGVILVTIGFNVPLNNTLAAVDPNSADGATRWARFVPSWTAWNSVRATASIAAAAALIIALVVSSAGRSAAAFVAR